MQHRSLATLPAYSTQVKKGLVHAQGIEGEQSWGRSQELTGQPGAHLAYAHVFMHVQILTPG